MQTRHLAVALFLLAGAGLARANEEIDTGHVHISFDTENSYQASVYSDYSGALYETYSLPSYMTVGNALIIPAYLSADIGASGYADAAHLNFNLHDIDFSAQDGYAITGYRLTFNGRVGSVGDGWYDIGGSEGTDTLEGEDYSFSTGIVASLPASYQGWVNLYAPYVENEEGGADVFGTAFGSIDGISIEAITAPVPEPEAYALMLAGLVSLGLATRRRQAKR